jgi:hypothetical protein
MGSSKKHLGQSLSMAALFFAACAGMVGMMTIL